MSKLKDTLLMMAEQKENFKIGDKTFQIIEVVEAEQPKVNPYHDLIGKWYKCIMGDLNYGFVFNKWYAFENPLDNDGVGIVTSEDNGKVGFRNVERWFDLTNPQNESPDEVKKILVPSEIGIGKKNDYMGIIFGGNQVLLSPEHLSQNYIVWGTDVCTPIQCELIKCERAELKKGDIAFRGDEETSDFNELSRYSVIINESRHCFVDDETDVIVSSTPFKHWYKLQPIEQ